MGIIANHFKQLDNGELLQAIIELRNKRIIAQQKRCMNSFGRWSKMMRDKYGESN